MDTQCFPVADIKYPPRLFIKIFRVVDIHLCDLFSERAVDIDIDPEEPVLLDQPVEDQKYILRPSEGE